MHRMSSGDLLREWICSRSCGVYPVRQRHVLRHEWELDVHGLRGRLVFELHVICHSHVLRLMLMLRKICHHFIFRGGVGHNLRRPWIVW